jgi:hypothetical protein
MEAVEIESNLRNIASVSRHLGTCAPLTFNGAKGNRILPKSQPKIFATLEHVTPKNKKPRWFISGVSGF